MEEDGNINQQIVPQGITLALINYMTTLCWAKKNLSLGQPSIPEEVGEDDNINRENVSQGIILALINSNATLCWAKKINLLCTYFLVYLEFNISSC